MALTFPTTGFTGTEVEAFETAYKELAQEIMNRYDNANVIKDDLLTPYRNSDLMKIFLQEGLIYTSFIIKQRAGNSGPGTDFILGSSPFSPTASNEDLDLFMENLGCIFTHEEMSNAWNYNKDRDPALDPYDALDPIIDDLLDALLNGGKGKTRNLNWDKLTEKLLEGDSGDISLREKAIIDLWKRLRGGPFGGAIQKALEKYLGNDKTALTQGDFNAHELNKMKDHLQDHLNSGNGRWVDNHPVQCPNCYPYANLMQWAAAGRPSNACHLQCRGASNYDVTSSYADGSYGADFSAGDTIREMTLYDTDLHKLFGTATVVVDGAGNIKSIHDDFDFAYGNEIDRNADGSLPGQTYNDANIKHGSMFNSTGTNVEEVMNNVNGGHRKTIANAKGDGRGKPVPISITFP